MMFAKVLLTACVLPCLAQNCMKGPEWHTQGVTDSHCQNCGGNGSPGTCWWPCTTCGLCSEGCNKKCGGDPCSTVDGETTTVATTTQGQVTTAPVTTSSNGPATTEPGTGNPSPSVCRAGPDAASQSVGDEQCQNCNANGSACWWPCNVCGLCSAECNEKCGVDPCEATTSSATTASTTTTTTIGGGAENNGLCSKFGPKCAYQQGVGIAAWFTEEMFNEMFPQRCDSACQGCDLLIYDCLVQAAQEYSDTFANTGNIDTDRRELAAWLGIMSQETTGGGCHAPVSVDENGNCGECAGTPPTGLEWCHNTPNGGCYAWGLCFVIEQGGNSYCDGSNKYPCQPGRLYSGRGPKQLSWNYNYGQFSESACGNKMVLLEHPDWVATNSRLAWSSSIWFWMTGGACNPELGENCKPSPHSVVIGTKKMCPKDVEANREYGLGWATNIVNGGLECGTGTWLGKCDYRVHSRVEFYKRFATILGVNHLAAGWTDESLYCGHQMNYGQSPPTRCEDSEAIPVPPPSNTQPPAPSHAPSTTTASSSSSEQVTTAPGTGNPSPSMCRAGPEAASQGVTDEQCQNCNANGSECWWPCNVCGLCSVECNDKCGTDPCVTTTTLATTATTTTTSAGTGGENEGLCSKTGSECTYQQGVGIAAWFTEAMFDEMFPQRCDSACQGCDMLIYDCLIQAAQDYSDTFANSGDVDTDRRELAAWLGVMSQETTGGGCHSPVSVDENGNCGECAGSPDTGLEWCHNTPNGGCYAWGLCFVVEQGGNAYCSPGDQKYPCQPGRLYKGRGPKQLSWNYNYGQFSESACGDKMVLLDHPDWVASNPRLAWSSSIWFWMTGGACNPELGEKCKPSPHSVVVGTKRICPKDIEAGREFGLGWATNIVNGGLECGSGTWLGKCDYRVHSRVEFYKRFSAILGVNHLAPDWTDESLYCSHQMNYGQSPPTYC